MSEPSAEKIYEVEYEAGMGMGSRRFKDKDEAIAFAKSAGGTVYFKTIVWSYFAPPPRREVMSKWSAEIAGLDSIGVQIEIIREQTYEAGYDKEIYEKLTNILREIAQCQLRLRSISSPAPSPTPHPSGD